MKRFQKFFNNLNIKNAKVSLSCLTSQKYKVLRMRKNVARKYSKIVMYHERMYCCWETKLI